MLPYRTTVQSQIVQMSNVNGKPKTLDFEHWTLDLVIPAASVPDLAPLNFWRVTARLVSYYALFEGWLLLSKPPSCLGNDTSFPT